jgi:hypothetical protein
VSFQNDFTTAVIEALNQRQATVRPCPMCTSRTWTLANGVVMPPLVNISGRVMSQGATLPSVALVCNTCAFIAYYSLVALQLGHLIPR